MVQLLLFNLLLIAIIIALLTVVKKKVKSQKSRDIILLVSAVFTILCHYSSLPYHFFTDGMAMEYLKSNPNLILPIYPCNVVMWSCLIFALLKNKDSKLGHFLADYIFWFGIISTLVGMFANVDFIRNPTLADFDVTKGIISHATLLFNVLLMPVFGHFEIKMERNIKNIVFSIIEMLVIGLYCNLVFLVLVSENMAYQVNSMFLIHSPFEGVDFLTYPVIALIAIPLYFGVFAICECISYPKGSRFTDRLRSWIKTRKKYIEKN